MSEKATLRPDRLAQVLRYEPDTGRLYWRERSAEDFPATFARCRRKAAELAASFNTKFAGRQALTANNGTGYRTGSVLGLPCLAHRVAYALHHGHWPEGQIDHMNGDRSDNRAENLRSVSHKENGRNVQRPAHNRSGVIGVSWNRERGLWYASIQVDGRTKSLGRYARLSDAVAARKAAEQRFGFGPTHGRAPA